MFNVYKRLKSEGLCSKNNQYSNNITIRKVSKILQSSVELFEGLNYSLIILNLSILQKVFEKMFSPIFFLSRVLPL